MRILHLTPRYHPVEGGAERYWREISSRLAARGHQVTILTSDADHFEYFWDRGQSRLASRVSFDGPVVIHRLPLRHWRGKQWGYRGRRRILWLANQVGASTQLLFRLAKQTPRFPALWNHLETLRQPFDIVAATNVAYEQFGMAGLHFARRKNIPFVYFPLTHLGAGIKPASDKLSSFYTQRHQIAIAQSSHGLVTITPTEAEYYIANGVSRRLVRVAEPGFSPPEADGGIADRWRQEHNVDNPIVLFLGTMSFDKGTIHLLTAARQLWEQGQLFTLVLAGQPTAEFQQYFAKLSGAERQNIRLRIKISEAEKLDLLAAASLLALPSRVESFGIVFLEAWAYHKPVIAASTWGIAEDVVHHEQDGLLVEFGNISELADAISRLLSDDLLAKRLGHQGHANLARRYQWADKIDIIESLYRTIA